MQWEKFSESYAVAHLNHRVSIKLFKRKRTLYDTRCWKYHSTLNKEFTHEGRERASPPDWLSHVTYIFGFIALLTPPDILPQSV